MKKEIDVLKALLLDPDGKCSIGSEEDNQLIEGAIKSLEEMKERILKTLKWMVKTLDYQNSLNQPAWNCDSLEMTEAKELLRRLEE